MGTVYLIHFEFPYKHARHYLGYSAKLSQRAIRHSKNNGARLIQVINAAGISWSVVRTWPGNRGKERRLKKRHDSPILCPVCNPKSWNKNGG